MAVAAVRFPPSEQFEEVSPTDGKELQCAIFRAQPPSELHPEQQAPYEVELGLLGVQQYKTQAIAGDQLPFGPPKDVHE